MLAQEHLSGNESWQSPRIPVLFLLPVSLDFISVLGKLGGKNVSEVKQNIFFC